jgi:hypothetical protein
MSRCFVIQPFDKGPFDKRYRDILAPAIVDAGLDPYRVDEDPSANILIDDIESGIGASAICLADITTDNPNVWYEVGFAFANEKPVVMICTDPRPTPYPFDIRHRHVIPYKLESPSEFEKLKSEITVRLKAKIEKGQRLQSIASLSSVKETEGLTNYEMAALACIMENRLGPESAVRSQDVRDDMQKAGYTNIAASLSLESLFRKEMVQYDTAEGEWGSYPICRITERGVAWLLENQDRFVLRVEKARAAVGQITDDDIPF